MEDGDLISLGRRRQRARENLAKVTAEAKEAAIQAVNEGRSEAEVARLMKIDRMTIRDWLGKKR